MSEFTLFDAVVSIVVWVVLALYFAGDLYWLYEMVGYGWRYRDPERAYGPEDVQVRILTIADEPVVRETVAKLPDALDECYVIAEDAIDVPGADVRVVPESFDCLATNKGRALEWARQEIACDREYILYLDEDSHVLEFDGVPDADVVQFAEYPRKTESLLCYLADLNRVGFQFEQRAFASLPVPLYAWGGGLAIRTSLEDEITWDYPTLIEDTVFMWRAVTEADASFAYVTDRISNQSPPGLRALLKQRRRWIAGSREDNTLLSTDRILMYGIRDLSWSVTGIIPVLALVSVAPSVDIQSGGVYRAISLGLLAFMYVWIVLGIVHQDASAPMAVLALVLAPITTVVHSVGACWGLLSTPETFDVTEKVVESDPSNGLTQGPVISDGGPNGDVNDERIVDDPLDT